VSAGAKITDRDHGLKKLKAKLRHTRKGTVSVGIHEAEGAAQAQAGPGEKPSGATVAMVAESHEFGLGAPQRSFIRGPVDQHQATLQGQFREAVQSGMLSNVTPEQALSRFGLYVVGLLQQTMADGGSYAGLAPSTEARRAAMGMSPPYVPLIVTGQLRSSIRSKVTL